MLYGILSFYLLLQYSKAWKCNLKVGTFYGAPEQFQPDAGRPSAILITPINLNLDCQ